MTCTKSAPPQVLFNFRADRMVEISKAVEVRDWQTIRITSLTSTLLQVLFNFRADRMVEISKAFEYEEFGAFDRKRWPKVRCRH